MILYQELSCVVWGLRNICIKTQNECKCAVLIMLCCSQTGQIICMCSFTSLMKKGNITTKSIVQSVQFEQRSLTAEQITCKSLFFRDSKSPKFPNKSLSWLFLVNQNHSAWRVVRFPNKLFSLTIYLFFYFFCESKTI